MLKPSRLPAALMLALFIAAVACGEDTQAPPSTDGDSATAAPTTTVSDHVFTIEEILTKDPGVTKRAEVVWGSMFEESGALVGFGEPAGDGVKLAVQEINEAGGFQVGDTIYTIRLIELDTRSEITQAVAVATELVRDHGVNVIWGSATIGDAETTAITQPRKIIHICPCPNREVTSLASVELAQGDNHWAFQTLPAASKFLAPGARDARQEYPDYETFATICVNTEIGRSFCQFFEDAYTAAGFEHVGRDLLPTGTTDFRPILTNLKSKDPDMILNFVDAGPPQFALLQQSWQLDVGKWYIGVAIPYDIFEALVGPGIRDKIVAAGAAPRTHAIYTSDKARDYFELKYRPYKGGGDLPPGAFASLLTYDPTYMLAAAMQLAGTVEDTDRITAALEQVHFSGYGEDDLYFDRRHIIVSGNDSCLIHQGEMTCEHHAPPAEPAE